MATATAQTNKTNPTFDLPSVEEATKRVRDLNERMIESSKSAGLQTLDTYENALQSLADFSQKVGSASQPDWVSALVATQAKFVTDVSASYTQAARTMLKK